MNGINTVRCIVEQILTLWLKYAALFIAFLFNISTWWERNRLSNTQQIHTFSSSIAPNVFSKPVRKSINMNKLYLLPFILTTWEVRKAFWRCWKVALESFSLCSKHDGKSISYTTQDFTFRPRTRSLSTCFFWSTNRLLLLLRKTHLVTFNFEVDLISMLSC